MSKCNNCGNNVEDKISGTWICPACWHDRLFDAASRVIKTINRPFGENQVPTVKEHLTVQDAAWAIEQLKTGVKIRFSCWPETSYIYYDTGDAHVLNEKDEIAHDFSFWIMQKNGHWLLAKDKSVPEEHTVEFWVNVYYYPPDQGRKGHHTFNVMPFKSVPKPGSDSKIVACFPFKKTFKTGEGL